MQEIPPVAGLRFRGPCGVMENGGPRLFLTVLFVSQFPLNDTPANSVLLAICPPLNPLFSFPFHLFFFLFSPFQQTLIWC
jgi:hypothetical protein